MNGSTQTRRATTLIVAVLLSVTACGGSGTIDESANTSAAVTSTSSPSGAVTSTTSAPDSGTTQAPEPESTTTSVAEASAAIPDSCAEGFAEYLTNAEPLVADFDPSTAVVGDIGRYDDAVNEVASEMLEANDYTAPYSCSEIGLQWAYFDSRSPWDAVLTFAGERAPGTVAYLTALRDMSTAEENKVLADYGVTSCDEAVARITQAVADQIAAGFETVAHMPIGPGLELYGLYNAYLVDVRAEVCPRDVLGNTEFGFMYERLPG